MSKVYATRLTDKDIQDRLDQVKKFVMEHQLTQTTLQNKIDQELTKTVRKMVNREIKEQKLDKKVAAAVRSITNKQIAIAAASSFKDKVEQKLSERFDYY